MPALSFNGEIIIESAIVSNFLANQYPSHLWPASSTAGAAIQRARIEIFVDCFINKFQTLLQGLLRAKSDAEQQAVIDKAVAGLLKEVEPRLADAAPFFGGSDKLTQAEVLTGSFALRLLAYHKNDLYPRSFYESIQERAPNFAKWVEAVAVHPSVTSTFNEQANILAAKARFAKLRAENGL